jgi:hypothetical protein
MHFMHHLVNPIWRLVRWIIITTHFADEQTEPQEWEASDRDQPASEWQSEITNCIAYNFY